MLLVTLNACPAGFFLVQAAKPDLSSLANAISSAQSIETFVVCINCDDGGKFAAKRIVVIYIFNTHLHVFVYVSIAATVKILPFYKCCFRYK